MNVTKKIIASCVSEEANISQNDSMSILNKFIELVIDNARKNKLVKIAKFGSLKVANEKELEGTQEQKRIYNKTII